MQSIQVRNGAGVPANVLMQLVLQLDEAGVVGGVKLHVPKDSAHHKLTDSFRFLLNGHFQDFILSRATE